MADPKPGDTVVCRFKDGAIVSCYSAYDATYHFQVIASDYWGFYVYVPDYLGLSGSSKIDYSTATHLNIKPHFVGCKMLYIRESQIASVRPLDGCVCSRCNEFFAQAQANEGESFMCFLCRTYKYR